jgi:Ankyrin repeat
VQGVVTMVWVQWALLDEFEKDVDAIDWERVCMLVNASPVVCKVKDEYGWYPLHFACYANAPLYVIQFLLRTFGDALKEDQNTNGENEDGALILACKADAPQDVIQYLVDTTLINNQYVADEAHRIVIERKRELDVVRCVSNEWSCYESMHERVYNFPQSTERALYRLQKNDAELTHIRIGWPLPSESVLRDVVEAIASNSTIERIDFVAGEYDILPWWQGEEDTRIELLKSALAANTSIMDIRVKVSDAIFDNHMIEIVQSSRQLRSLLIRNGYTSGEMAAKMMRELSIERLSFQDGCIREEVAEIIVEALKGDHRLFTEVNLFKESSDYSRWRCQSKSCYFDNDNDWKKSIAAKIKKLTWSNHFKVDKDTFLKEVLGPASVKEKFDLLCHKRCVTTWTIESCSDNAKLCYHAMEAANRYDYFHQATSDAPSMLYSLIRDMPEVFSQCTVYDRAAEQQMTKKQRRDWPREWTA